MKKSILVVAALFACVVLSAQSKGEKYIAVSVSASFGNETIETYDGAYTTSDSGPLTTSVDVMGEFGYFIADNVRLALALGVPYSSTPVTQSGNTWLRRNTLGFQINPNIAYYVRLADNFYYTPEIGFSYQFGSYKEDMTASTSRNLNYNGWSIYANILALEFRVSPKLAIGAGVGSVSYVNGKYSMNGAVEYFKDGQLRFDLNGASVHLRFYL
jgi:hypothetical protein